MERTRATKTGGPSDADELHRKIKLIAERMDEMPTEDE